MAHLRRWSQLCLFVLALGIPAQLLPSLLAQDRDSQEATQSEPTAPALVGPRTDDASAVLQQAMELERRKDWAGAIEAYEDAVKTWPSRVEFRQRLRLCEIHYRLGRRYQDSSFRNVLLRLPRDRALDLFEEVLDRIETHYVETVAIDQLIRRGYDNLDVALRDDVFLKSHLSGMDAKATAGVRDSLRARRAMVAALDRGRARAEVIAACEDLQGWLRLSAAPVVLEFVYGCCDALDDYTSYLTPDKLEDLYAMIDGNFVGLGVELKHDPKGLKIVGVIPGGPADEAGLKVGDRITSVDGKSLDGMGLDESATRLQGLAGTTVRLEVQHADARRSRATMTRRPIEVQSVSQARILDQSAGIGYIQLTGFQKSSTDEMHRAMGALQDKGLRILILDLRGNPGGLLNIAVEIADRFLDKGRIVLTRGRAQGQSLVYDDSTPALWRMQVIVLVDHDSASASEILAGALQENKRALVVGERSFGKGSVQSIFALRSVRAGLKLTTAKFYSPMGRAYSEQGVTPDVPVRVVAKPVVGETVDEDAISTTQFGRPGEDAVLDHALSIGKKWSNTAKSGPATAKVG